MQRLKLIQLYFHVCQLYEEELKWHSERFSNNGFQPNFTDCELLTTYLFSVGFEQRFQVKQVHRYIKNHWLDWFPELPSYQRYNKRLNRLAGIFPILIRQLLQVLAFDIHALGNISLTDSMPIMTCSNRRKAKVALDLCNKGYNSVKKRHFYGVKLHAIGFSNPGTLPHIEYLQITPASVHDLIAQQEILSEFKNRIVVGDKAFRAKALDGAIKRNGGELLTPVVYQSNLQRFHRQRDRAADDLYSRMVSSIRQPIESLFNWIIEKTDVQRASKVRSSKGLHVHIFAKIAAALMALVIEPIFN